MAMTSTQNNNVSSEASSWSSWKNVNIVENDEEDVSTGIYNWSTIKANDILNYDVFARSNFVEDLCYFDSIEAIPSSFGDLHSFSCSTLNIGDSHFINSCSTGNVHSASSFQLSRTASMLLSVRLGKSDGSANDSSIHSQALLDSGASANLISEALVLASRIPVVKKTNPYKVIMANQSVASTINYQTLPIWFSLGAHSERISFDVIPSLSYPLIVGLPWLVRHNPVVDWKT